MEDKLNRMRSLVNQLNQASDVYYNGKGEILTDYEWDALFDQLKKLEEETGEILPDSPTKKFLKIRSSVRRKNTSSLLSLWQRPRRSATSSSGQKTALSGFPGSWMASPWL